MKKSILTLLGTILLSGVFVTGFASNNYCPHAMKIPGIDTNKPDVYVQCDDAGTWYSGSIFDCNCHLAGKDLKTYAYRIRTTCPGASNEKVEMIQKCTVGERCPMIPNPPMTTCAAEDPTPM